MSFCYDHYVDGVGVGEWGLDWHASGVSFSSLHWCYYSNDYFDSAILLLLLLLVFNFVVVFKALEMENSILQGLYFRFSQNLTASPS